MSMPKGKKHEHGYATVTNQGKGYREIAEILSSEGHKMNHASARNYFLRGLQKLAKPLEKHSSRSARDISRDPRFQSAIAEILKEYETNGIINI